MTTNNCSIGLTLVVLFCAATQGWSQKSKRPRNNEVYLIVNIADVGQNDLDIGFVKNDSLKIETYTNPIQAQRRAAELNQQSSIQQIKNGKIPPAPHHYVTSVDNRQWRDKWRYNEEQFLKRDRGRASAAAQAEKKRIRLLMPEWVDPPKSKTKPFSEEDRKLIEETNTFLDKFSEREPEGREIDVEEDEALRKAERLAGTWHGGDRYYGNKYIFQTNGTFHRHRFHRRDGGWVGQKGGVPGKWKPSRDGFELELDGHPYGSAQLSGQRLRIYSRGRLFDDLRKD
jgi:hypothetical protein